MKKQVLFYTYNALIWVSNLYIFIGKYFSDRLLQVYTGRKETWVKLEALAATHPKVIWFHCASLGEFEQGRPVIEKIKRTFPDQAIVLSFFSPSGYQIRRNYDHVDLVVYLPSDLISNAHRLLSIIQPTLFVFVKYEFWWNLIDRLIHSGSKVILISAVFRQNHYFFKKMYRPFKELLQKYTAIFVQDQASLNVLRMHQFHNQYCVGDTRVDRVIQRSKSLHLQEALIEFVKDTPVVVYGSIWPSDLDVVKSVMHAFPNFTHIIAPHQIHKSNVAYIQKSLGGASLFSDLAWHKNVLIIDNIGLLSSLYSLSKYAYIGGGFQKGIHNILEALVFKIPVFFGPNHTKFNEAVALIQLKAAFTIQNPNDMKGLIENFEKDPLLYQKIKIIAEQYINDNKGAADKILEFLNPYLPIA